MADYPDENEEFELMYGEELELLRQSEDNFEENVVVPKSRRSLDFNTVSDKNFQANRTQSNAGTQDVDFGTQNSFVEPSQPSNGTGKRTVNDLFGDIDDIILEESYNLPYPKRQKTEEENKQNDLELIDMIVTMRKTNDEAQNLSVRNNVQLPLKYDPKYNLSYKVPKYSFIPVTRYDDKRIYVRFHSELYEKEDVYQYVSKINQGSFSVNSFRNVWDEAHCYLENLKKRDDVLVNSNISVLDNSSNETTNLWVDLYKPKRYLELLSDESTNRTLLKWLKLWDKVVFNRKPKMKPVVSQDAKSNAQNFSKFKNFELSTKLDEHGRPEHKIVLMCGPPGLGKTTLAHMVARHAGYNVVEVNASDERNVETFRRILETSTQMTSVVDKENRPNCLIFDEIDGAPAASVEFLIKFINGDHVPKTKKKGQPNQAPKLLKRPIICICNDVYVPALRSLRKVAFVINFPPIASLRLAERMCEIARNQRVKTDLGAMLALSVKVDNDIRTCLSVLHFYKARNAKLTLSEVHETSVGQKDMCKSLFAVWKDIFTFKDATLKNRMSAILKMVNSFGDYERLMGGIFENFGTVLKETRNLSNVAIALDEFCHFDVINKQILSAQSYELGTYLPYSFVVWHFAFALKSAQQQPKLKFPNADYESRMRALKNDGIVREILNGIQPTQAVFVDYSSLIMDVLPYLSRLIVPTFRAVNEHLHSSEEKEDLKRIVGVMADYNLTYVQERTADGMYAYNIEPDIDSVVGFPETGHRGAISYGNKQILAREVEMVKMSRLEAFKNRNVDKEKKDFVEKVKAVAKTIVAEPVYKDFFGRIVERPKIKRNVRSDDHEIHYKYKEGFTNAFRRKISIAYLR